MKIPEPKCRRFSGLDVTIRSFFYGKCAKHLLKHCFLRKFVKRRLPKKYLKKEKK